MSRALLSVRTVACRQQTEQKAKRLNKLVEMSTFVAVVDAGSLAAAARASDTSKSVVSTRLTALESRLKVALFRRDRELHVNDAGLRFYDHCVSILDDVADAQDGMQSTYAGFSGNLRIATPMVLVIVICPQS